MPPGLRPIGGGGQGRRPGLGRVGLDGGCRNPAPGAGDAVAEACRGDSGATGADWMPLAPGTAPERSWSLDMVPLGTMMPVTGCSADTEKALPYGPAMV